jgi:limonene-1,2-epoxide hydrolase
MQSVDPTALVEAYLDALVARDDERIRAMLSHQGFHYESPIASCDGADDYLQYLMMTAGIVRRIERLRAFADGGDVCHWLRVETQLSERVSTKMVQWAKVADGRITSIEMLFDPYRYRMLFDAAG